MWVRFPGIGYHNDDVDNANVDWSGGHPGEFAGTVFRVPFLSVSMVRRYCRFQGRMAIHHDCECCIRPQCGRQIGAVGRIAVKQHAIQIFAVIVPRPGRRRNRSGGRIYEYAATLWVFSAQMGGQDRHQKRWHAGRFVKEHLIHLGSALHRQALPGTCCQLGINQAARPQGAHFFAVLSIVEARKRLASSPM